VKELSWQKAIILNPNEQVLHSWDGNCERHHKAVVKAVIGHRTVEAKETHSGTLVLTNQRLLWFERRGFLSKTERASFEIDLGNLKGITCGGTINKWVSITDSEAESVFHLAKVGAKEIEPFRDMVLRQVEKVKVTAMGSSEATPTFHKEVVTKEIVMIPCEYCRSLMPQTSTFCPNCGAKRRG
jgi:hypothetical protein